MKKAQPKCPDCGSTKSTKEDVGIEGNYFRCLKCGGTYGVGNAFHRRARVPSRPQQSAVPEPSKIEPAKVEDAVEKPAATNKFPLEGELARIFDEAERHHAELDEIEGWIDESIRKFPSKIEL